VGVDVWDGTPIAGLKGLFLVSGADNSPATGDAYQGVYSALNWTGVPIWAKFFFQLVFAGTAATIVSGAVAERIKFHSFMIFSFIIVALMYPITGHWIWGGGWLQNWGCGILRVRRLCIQSAVGRRWPASCCWGRASASIVPTVPPNRSMATT
jgi:hypothetical protein